MANYQIVKKKVIIQHPAHFWPFLNFQAEKLMPPLQISFKGWLYDEDLIFFYINVTADRKKS